MPLHVDRSSISLTQATLHEHSLDRTQRDRGAADADEAAASPDVAVDVRMAAPATDDVQNLDRAEQLVRTLRAGAIAHLRSVHVGLDPARAAALLTD